MMFFFLACGIGSLGPGNVATAAMLAPMAMAVSARAGIPAFLMAIMVGNGAQAAALSPFAPTGIIVNGLMAKIGLGGHEFWNYWTNLVAHAAVAFGGYLLLGGIGLFRREYSGDSAAAPATVALDRRNWITMAVILAVMAAVLFANANIGMAAFAGAVVLAALGVADHDDAIRKVPWKPIIMVSGVTVLVGLLEKTGGLDLFTALLARAATRDTLTGMIAFVTGLISVYSSTSGVVLPAFLPTVPGLVMRLGGGDPLSVAASMNIGAHLVDMSPLSTTGAICMAGISDPAEVKRTYTKLLIWGLSMTIVGAIGCYLFF
jgi:Na+/H+ antiporter NhaD/arsenite permease-like protein